MARISDSHESRVRGSGSAQGHKPNLAPLGDAPKPPSYHQVENHGLPASFLFAVRELTGTMGHDAVWNSHPKNYGEGSRKW